VAAEYQAAGEGDEVAGALYDIFKIAPGRWRSAIGVSGDPGGDGLWRARSCPFFGHGSSHIEAAPGRRPRLVPWLSRNGRDATERQCDGHGA